MRIRRSIVLLAVCVLLCCIVGCVVSVPTPNCTLDSTIYAYSFTTKLGWMIGNTSQSSDPIEDQCSLLATIVSYFTVFEGDFCYNADARLIDGISGCDMNSDGTLCYSELPTNATCLCMGTSLQNWCASVMFENRAVNNTRRLASV
jgi:hypothetical protein